MLTFRSCLLFILVACGPTAPVSTETAGGEGSTDPLGGSTTTTATTTTTTADPTTGAVGSTGADTSGSFMLPPDEGVNFIIPLDGGSGCGCGAAVSGLRCKECDPWVQDCPEGEKCTPCDGSGSGEWNAQKCIPLPVDPDHAGEPCTVEGSIASGIDSCDLATVCWFIDPMTLTGTCVLRCIGSLDAPVCAEGTSCMISNDGVLNLCLPTCDPLGDDCGPGQLCIVNNTTGTDFVCVPDKSGGGGQLFDSCEFFNTCDPGLLCTLAELALECDPMASGCCLPFCDLTMPAPCPGAMQECLPFFPEDPPPGHEDLGVCGIPG